ncbi:MAG: YlxM family DNA-binding protein [Lachnospiraceae bacterium]|nr:YlxM family DNA-binding protein [Lachnospiraceae bacterium]
MDELFEKSLLYDFYGELLTDHQKSIYERSVFDDMSLAEVAEEEGISRQGVHDLIKRCDKILQGYEDKLHLVSKFVSIKKKASDISLLSGETDPAKMKGALKEISKLSEGIIEEL